MGKIAFFCGCFTFSFRKYKWMNQFILLINYKSFTLLTSDPHYVYFYHEFEKFYTALINENISMILISLHVP